MASSTYIFKGKREHCPVPVAEGDADGLTKIEAITNLSVVGLHAFRCLLA